MPGDQLFNQKNEEYSFHIETDTKQISEQIGARQRDNRILTERGYNEEALERENTLLSRRLADKALFGEIDERLRMQSMAFDRTRIVRNKSILLFRNGTEESDSLSMSYVKKSLKKLDQILRRPVEGGFDGVIEAYNTAINYMTEYELSHHPFFFRGKRRKKMVVELRDSLMQERERLAGKVRMIEGEIPENMRIPMDILEENYVRPDLTGGPLEIYENRKKELLSLNKENGDIDGEEMQNIKSRFKALGARIQGPVGQGAEYEKQINDLKTAYNDVIFFCDLYVKGHNPWTAEGKERLAAVQSLMERCEHELKFMVEYAESMTEAGKQFTWEEAFGAASTLTDEYLSGRQKMEKFLGNRPTARKILITMSSFRAMHQHNETKYAMLEDNLLSEWLEKNLDEKMIEDLVTERFKVLEPIAKAYKELVSCPVPRAFLKNKDDNPMDPSLRSAFARLRMQSDPAFKILKPLNFISMKLGVGFKSENSEIWDRDNSPGVYYAEQLNEHFNKLSHEDKKYADEMGDIANEISAKDYKSLNKEAVDEYLALVEKEELDQAKHNLTHVVSSKYLEYKKNDEKKSADARVQKDQDILIKEVEEVLKKASELGIKTYELTSAQKTALLDAGMDAYAAEVNRVLDTIKQSAAHFGEKALKVYESKAGEYYAKAAYYAVMSVCSVTDYGKTLAEYQQKKFVAEAVYEVTDKPELKELSEKMYIAELSSGEGGLIDAAKDAGIADKEASELGTSQFADLCNDLRDMYMLQGKAVTDGLDAEEADKIAALGRKVDKLLADKKALSCMKLVSDALSGTRFKEGFNKAVALSEGGFSFEKACKKIGNETLIKEEKEEEQEEKKEENVKKETAPEKKKEKKETKKVPEIITETINVLNLKKVASVAIDNMTDEKAAKDLAGGVIAFKEALLSLNKDKEEKKEVKVGSITYSLIQFEDNTLIMTSPSGTVTLTNTAEEIVNSLRSDIASNISLYGKGAVLKVLEEAESRTTKAQDSTLRSLCLHSLEGSVQLSAAFFANMATADVVRMAKCALNGEMTKEQIMHRVQSIEDSVHINEEQTLTLLKRLEDDKTVSEKVVVKEPKEKEIPVKKEEYEFDEDEELAKNAIADLIFDKDTWVMDRKETGVATGARVKKILSNAKVVNVLVKFVRNNDNHSLDNFIDKLQLPDESLRKVFHDIVNEIVGPEDIKLHLERLKDVPEEEMEEEYKKLQEEYDFKNELREQLGPIRISGSYMANVLVFAKLKSMKDEEFENYAQKINNAVDEACAKIQDHVNDNIKLIFGTDNNTEPQGDDLDEEYGNDEEGLVLKKDKPKDYMEKGIGLEERIRRKKYAENYQKESSAILNKVVEENFTGGKRGQGRFMKIVLQNYFNGVSDVDKRAMIASAIRNMKGEKKLPEDAGEEVKEANKNRIMGNYLGGILKGAGPLLQKMLQGMPLDKMPEEISSALSDMKSKLSSIPDNVVQAELLDIVKRSKGKVEKIELKKSLGAASVGQAFLCRMYGPKFPSGKDVVVKLLRPDVRNRMMREKSIMRDCAKLTDKTGGMAKTFEGQLLRIEEELDLTIEARNIERGEVYNKYTNNIKSVKLDDSVEPTATSMVLEMAEGTTLDSYMTQVREIREEAMSPFICYETKVVDGVEKKVPRMVDINGEDVTKVELNEANLGKIQSSREKVRNTLKELQKRQKYLMDLAEAWVTEGIFRKGFYHGDLHSGNIMISSKGLTVIDFGNATKLGDAQLDEVARMMVAASGGVVSDFRSGFHKLYKMSGGDETLYQEKRQKLTEVFTKIMALGNQNTAGERIAAALIKAQELGLAIPPEIFNFSQSQLRLQNAIDEVNSMIKQLQKDVKALDSIPLEPKYSPFIDAVGMASLEMFSLVKGGNLAECVQHQIEIFDYQSDAYEVRQHLKVEDENEREEYFLSKLEKSKDCSYAVDSIRNMFFSMQSKKVGLKEKLKLKGALGEMKEADIELELEDFLQLLMENTKESFNKLIPVIGAKSVNDLMKSVEKNIRHPDDAGCEAEFNKLIDNLLQHPDLKRVCNTYNSYLEWKKAKEEKADEKVLSEKEEEFIEDYRQLEFFEEIEMKNDFKVYREMFFEETEMVRRRITSELEPFFADTRHRGPQLREAYNEFRKAQQESGLRSPAAMERFNIFFKGYHSMMVEVLKEHKKMLDEKVDMTEPEDFLDAMGYVLGANTKAAVKRLGGYMSMIPLYFKYGKLF